MPHAVIGAATSRPVPGTATPRDRAARIRLAIWT